MNSRKCMHVCGFVSSDIATASVYVHGITCECNCVTYNKIPCTIHHNVNLLLFH